VTIAIFEIVLNGIKIERSVVGTRADLREVFELHAAGKTKVIREVPDTLNESIDDVDNGPVAAQDRGPAAAQRLLRRG
jgi:propanol-preferring alcohol dehydrogenase